MRPVASDAGSGVRYPTFEKRTRSRGAIPTPGHGRGPTAPHSGRERAEPLRVFSLVPSVCFRAWPPYPSAFRIRVRGSSIPASWQHPDSVDPPTTPVLGGAKVLRFPTRSTPPALLNYGHLPENSIAALRFGHSTRNIRGFFGFRWRQYAARQHP